MKHAASPGCHLQIVPSPKSEAGLLTGIDILLSISESYLQYSTTLNIDMGSIAVTADTRELSDRLYAAVVVPLQADGETIDEEGYRRLVRYFVAAQEKQPDLALIANPEAGDIFYLSQEEQLKVATITVEEVAGRMPVFSGVASNSTRVLAEFSKQMMKTGIDGFFLAPPVGAMDVRRPFTS